MDADQIIRVLEQHREWLADHSRGQRANLREADLSQADLDYAAWPLWCGSAGVRVDERLIAQLAAHIYVLQSAAPGFAALQAALLPWAQRCHRAAELRIPAPDAAPAREAAR